MLLLLVSLIAFSSCFANESNAIVEQLIAETWKPLEVRVEWEFRKSSKQDLNSQFEYSIVQPKPTRFSGNLTLKLEGVSPKGETVVIPVSGKAKIFGIGFTPTEFVSAGETLQSDQLNEIELEWSRLNGEPLTEFESASSSIAARGLVPGRTICIDDIKPMPVILKDQPVILELSSNTVTISLSGRALKDGSIGDEIPVTVELQRTKRYRGIVVDETTVRFIQ